MNNNCDRCQKILNDDWKINNFVYRDKHGIYHLTCNPDTNYDGYDLLFTKDYKTNKELEDDFEWLDVDNSLICVDCIQEIVLNKKIRQNPNNGFLQFECFCEKCDKLINYTDFYYLVENINNFPYKKRYALTGNPSFENLEYIDSVPIWFEDFKRDFFLCFECVDYNQLTFYKGKNYNIEHLCLQNDVSALKFWESEYLDTYWNKKILNKDIIFFAFHRNLNILYKEGFISKDIKQKIFELAFL